MREMLSQLFHNSLVLLATGPRGSYRSARSSPIRHRYFHELEVAFKLAQAAGLIRTKYFQVEGRAIYSKVGENLIKIKKVVDVLEELRRDGWIKEIRNGRIFYAKRPPGCDHEIGRKEFLKEVFRRLAKIKGFGLLIDEGSFYRIMNKRVFEVILPAGEKALFSGATHFVGTWGMYSYFLSRLSIDMAAGEIIYRQKLIEAEKESLSFPIKAKVDFLSEATKEAQTKDIEEIKYALQADNSEEISLWPGISASEDLTFIISDVHLREFHHENTDEILRFIYMVKRLNGRLIINGDFFDVWRAGALERTWLNNTRIINALTKLKEVIFIAGNHDEFLSKLAKRGGILANPRFKVVESYSIPERQIKIFHGHQFDKINRPGSRIGRLGTKIITKMEFPRLRRFFGFLNKLTSGAFSSLAKFFDIFFGPDLSRRLELLLHLILPTSYVIRRRVQNILEWLRAEVEIAEVVEGMKASEEKPLVFIIGHLHHEGFAFLGEKIREAVKKEFGGKVCLIITDAWGGKKGYIGDYVLLWSKNEGEQSYFHLRKEIWRKSEY